MPDTVLLAGGSMIGVYICRICGAAILQRADDQLDQPTLHSQWHRALERERLT